MNIRELTVDRIGLSVRSLNALRREGVHTVGELLGYQEESLREIRNLGNKSVAEILEKIEEYKQLEGRVEEDDSDAGTEYMLPENFEDWIRKPAGRDFISSWVKNKGETLDQLELLSARAYNLFTLKGYRYLWQIIGLDHSEMMQIPRMDSRTATEIERACRQYLRDHEEEISSALKAEQEASVQEKAITSVTDILYLPDYHDAIIRYVKSNDRELKQLGLSKRAVNRLFYSQCTKMSDIVFMTRAEILRLPSMGVTSVDEIMAKIREYLSAHETRLIAVCTLL